MMEENKMVQEEPSVAPQTNQVSEENVNETKKAQEDSSKEELVEQLKALLEQPTDEIKEKVEQLKVKFYRLCAQEQTSIRDAKEELKESLEDYAPVVDEIEQNFRQLLAIYKQKKAEMHAKREAEMQQNKLRKENIISQMRTLSESETADVSGSIKQVRELQQEWKSIGAVPPQDATALTKEYNLYQERFYDLVKINNELREYDFKKNLEAKTALCEQAEALQERPDIVEAFRQLQMLHEQWANIGPVAREEREALWNRFKEASTIINKRHQDYFEQLHRQEDENLQKKQAIIEAIRQLDINKLTTSKMWEDANEKILSWQNEWRTIGFAPKKANQKIYDEYRELCNSFFAAKTAFYKGVRNTLNENLKKKQELLEKAEKLKDSKEWKTATATFVQLQKDWKTIGPVARKYSDDLWKRFTTACDYFFEQKKAEEQGQHTEEKENLQKKQDILKEIEEIAVGESTEETLTRLKELMARYGSIGHVPFKDKDKLYKRFRTACDRIFDQLHIDERNRRIDEFSKEMETKDNNSLLVDRRRLVRQYEALQQEIKTAENNILFFTAQSKKSNGLLNEMQKKIDGLHRQLTDLEAKINLIDSHLQ